MKYILTILGLISLGLGILGIFLGIDRKYSGKHGDDQSKRSVYIGADRIDQGYGSGFFCIVCGFCGAKCGRIGAVGRIPCHRCGNGKTSRTGRTGGGRNGTDGG